jgi:NAD(P)-dependent dehydrogenase (short-subunit alcohol dehydrogenase family)
MSTHSLPLAGRHVIVTGAGTGIGRAIAVHLAELGADLTLVARDAVRLEATAAVTRGRAGTVGVAACDIRDRASVDAVVDRAAADRGPLHALVANSGIGGPNGPGADDRFDDLVATNLTGTYSCLRAAQRNLRPGPDARHLVVTSSILARIAVPGYTGYSASKAGLLGLVRSLAAELGPDNVQVNALCPGWVDTEMSREGIQGLADALGTSFEDAYARAMSEVPMGRMSAPEDIGATVGWLLTSARGVTGQAIDQNGGAWMG